MVLLLIIFNIFIIRPSQAETLNINTGWTPPISTLLNEIMTATFERAEIKMEFHLLPGERSISLVGKGVDDGDCCRVPKAIAKDYPDLLQVPEIVYLAKFSAFAKTPHPKIENFDSLKPFSVATVSGWKILVNNLKRIEPETLHIMDEPESMFKILQKDRLDIATYGYLSGLQTINDLGLTDISAISPPLAEVPLYLYMNKKNADHIPTLAQALKELKAEGVIDEIIKSFTK